MSPHVASTPELDTPMTAAPEVECAKQNFAGLMAAYDKQATQAAA
jgi:hypothetical protein